MIYATSRYGVRYLPEAVRGARAALEREEGVDGPAIGEFERRFAQYHGIGHAVTSSYGRTAFHHILRAFDFPRGSEIIIPALTYWVVPEMARVCGLKPVFVDVDPATFNMDPAKLADAITSKTRAIVPTHLYGHPCDMDPIMRVARSRGLRVIEDCAQALGARYHDRLVGTFGDAAFFSFQMLKGVNCFGGGMAVTDDAALGGKIRQLAEADPWPSVRDVRRRLLVQGLERRLITGAGFTLGLFVGLYVGSFIGARDLTGLLWQKIRRLERWPKSYRQRFSNAQAILGLQGLDQLDAFNATSRAHAQYLTQGLRDLSSVVTPPARPDSLPVFYQYCIRVSRPGELSRRLIRRGIDIEQMHIDICNRLPLFTDYAVNCPIAESAASTLQLPVYPTLQARELGRIVQLIRDAAPNLPPLPDAPRIRWTVGEEMDVA